MRGRRLLGLAATAAVLVVAAGCGGGSSSTGGGGETGSGPHKGGILTIGTTNYIDSLNPFHYIETQSYQRHDHDLSPAGAVRRSRRATRTS